MAVRRSQGVQRPPSACNGRPGFDIHSGILRDWGYDFGERGLKRGTPLREYTRQPCFRHILGRSPEFFWHSCLSPQGHPKLSFAPAKPCVRLGVCTGGANIREWMSRGISPTMRLMAAPERPAGNTRQAFLPGNTVNDNV
jgi:hypothetical protein